MLGTQRRKGSRHADSRGGLISEVSLDVVTRLCLSDAGRLVQDPRLDRVRPASLSVGGRANTTDLIGLGTLPQSQDHAGEAPRKG